MTASSPQPLDVLDMDAAAVLDAYRSGTLKPSQAVEIYIDHQKRVNPRLNLVVEDRYDQARLEAAEYDRALAEGRMTGRLFGVPMSMKEALDVAGMHTTGALVPYRDRVAATDAEVVSRLRGEGAIILNKTNTPGLCFCQETDNLLFGRSNNPWNPAYTTGGSSGGEAGLIAVGGASAGFGSDIGGSIRIPSHFNGVVGFKPGARQFPDRGHFPHVTLPRQQTMLGFGPIVKSVRDAALIYSVIHPDFQPPKEWGLPSDLHVIGFGSFDQTRCTEDTMGVLSKAREALRGAGVEWRTEVPGFMKDVARVWQLIMSEDRGRGIIDLAYPGHPHGFWLDWLRYKLKLGPTHHRYLSWAIIGTNLFPPSTKQSAWIDRFIEDGQRRIEDRLGDHGVFIIPVYPSPAKPHGQVYAELLSVKLTLKTILPYIALANVFGLPAIVVPCGQTADGLPIGLQVVGRIGSEAVLFRTAAYLESALGGYRRNRAYDSGA